MTAAFGRIWKTGFCVFVSTLQVKTKENVLSVHTLRCHNHNSPNSKTKKLDTRGLVKQTTNKHNNVYVHLSESTRKMDKYQTLSTNGNN